MASALRRSVDDARPARVGVDESHVSGEIRAAVVVAQDHPFDQLLCDRIGDRVLRLGRLGAACGCANVERALVSATSTRRGDTVSRGTWVAGAARSGQAQPPGSAPRAPPPFLLLRRLRRAAAAVRRRPAWRAAVLASFVGRLGDLAAFGFAVDFACRPWACRISFRPSRASSPPAWRRLAVAWAAASSGNRETRSKLADRERTPATSASSSVPRSAPRSGGSNRRFRSQYLFR